MNWLNADLKTKKSECFETDAATTSIYTVRHKKYEIYFDSGRVPVRIYTEEREEHHDTFCGGSIYYTHHVCMGIVSTHGTSDLLVSFLSV